MNGQGQAVRRGWVVLGLAGGLLALLLGVLFIPSPRVQAMPPAQGGTGDVNGDGRCTEVDALAALQMASGATVSDLAVDVDGDGKVSELDALTLLQWAAAGGICQGPAPGPPTPPGPGPTPQTMPGGGPQITALEPSSAAVGQQVAVRGSGFEGQGTLTLNSFPVDPAVIVRWSDTEIVFQVPVRAHSGDVRVVTAVASNAVRLEVISAFTIPQPADMITDTSGIERVKSQILIGFQPGTDQPLIDQAVASVSGKVIGYDSALDVYQVEIAGADEAQVNQAVATLNALPEVEFAGPRYGSVGLQPPPDDTQYPGGSWAAGSVEQSNWWLRYMRMPQAWDIVQGSRATRLAVVDNGFLFTHPDLAGNVFVPPAPNDLRWTQEWDPNSGWVWEIQDHGTHVAGIAAAVGNNAYGVSGVSWQAGLMLYDWDFGQGNIVWDRVAGNLIRAVDGGARVINLSAGINWRIIKNQNVVTPADLDANDLLYVNTVHQLVARALRHAVRANRDVLWTFAAGNDTLPATFNGPPRTVTQFPNVMVVAALEEELSGQGPGRRADFSNYGDLVNIAAPGRDILSTIPTGTGPNAPVVPSFGRMSGTSMAAPAVAGLAALTWSGNPNLSAAQVKDCILTGAQTRGRTVQEVFNQAFAPHNFYAVDAVETLRACQAVQQPQPPMMPIPPWKQQAVRECIDRWLRLVASWWDQNRPESAPHYFDQYGHFWLKGVTWAGPPDDWISRWEGDKYKRMWFLAVPPPNSGIPPLQTYCGGFVDTTPVPVQPAPGPAPGAEPWKDPATVQCIETWMARTLDCAKRTWPDSEPWQWTPYGLLVGKGFVSQQPPIDWGTRYEGNKYKWIWLEHDARRTCPSVPSVQDFCSGAAGAAGQPPGGAGQQPPGGGAQPPGGVGQQPPGGAPVAPGTVVYSRFFSIDNSGSMSGTKIQEARQAALNTVANLPQGTEMALQFFGTSGCDVELRLDFTTDRNAMSEEIKKAGAHGSTPLAKAIEEAGAYVQANAHTSDRVIILLTDGKESCHGDPVDAARKINTPLAQPSTSAQPRLLSWLESGANVLASSGWAWGLLSPRAAPPPQQPPIRLHVVGFGIQPGSGDEQQLQQVAAAGGGQYFPAGTEAQLTGALTRAATQPTVIKGDADGDGRCTEVDALAALRMASGAEPPDLALDVDGDGKVAETDALTILQWAAAGGQCGP